MHKKILYLSLITTTALSYGLTPSQLVSLQFPQNTPVSNYLKNRIPFLLQTPKTMDKENNLENNTYTVNLEAALEDSITFYQFTGLDIEKTDYIASWYVFDSKEDIPSSVVEILNLVNNKKPTSFIPMARVNNVWRSEVQLPYKTLKENSLVFVYISMINRAGFLLPIGSQSFYEDMISGTSLKKQNTMLSLDLVRFWYEKGYYAYIPETVQ